MNSSLPLPVGNCPTVPLCFANTTNSIIVRPCDGRGFLLAPCGTEYEAPTAPPAPTAGSVYGIIANDDDKNIAHCPLEANGSADGHLVSFNGEAMTGGGVVAVDDRRLLLPVSGVYKADYRLLVKSLSRQGNYASFQLVRNSSQIVPRSQIAVASERGSLYTPLSGSVIFKAVAGDRLSLASNTTTPTQLAYVKQTPDLPAQIGSVATELYTDTNTATVTVNDLEEGTNLLVVVTIKGTETHNILVTDDQPNNVAYNQINRRLQPASTAFGGIPAMQTATFATTVVQSGTVTVTARFTDDEIAEVFSITALEVENVVPPVTETTGIFSNSFLGNQEQVLNLASVTSGPSLQGSLGIVGVFGLNYDELTSGANDDDRSGSTPLVEQVTGNFLSGVSFFAVPPNPKRLYTAGLASTSSSGTFLPGYTVVLLVPEQTAVLCNDAVNAELSVHLLSADAPSPMRKIV